MLEPLYLAGLIDGEGHIGFNVNVQGKYRYLRPCLEINMTFQPLISLLHLELGGHYSNHVDARKDRKAQYRWRVVSQQAVSVIEKVFPYLIVKKEQADLVLVFNKYGKGNNEAVNAFFKEEMHKLNHKGPNMEGEIL